MVFAIGAAVLGAGVGIYNANKQGRAADQANTNNMASYNQYQPYVDAGLAGGQTAFNNTLAAGNYQGDTYAGPNMYQTSTANTMATNGMDMITQGNNQRNANAGFGDNARDLYARNIALGGQGQDLYNQGAGLYGQNQDLYNQNQGIANQFQGLNQAAQVDRMGVASQYARDNSGALVDSAMRGELRTLQEQTRPGIDMAASGSGNTNSSRAGMENAIAQRGYDDRRADMTANINSQLMDRSLAQQAQQFSDQSGAISNAGNALGAASGNLAGAGSSLSNQGNLINNVGGQYNNAGVANNSIQSAYNTGVDTMRQGGDFGMMGGNQLQGYDQARLTDDQNRFNNQRDFEYNRYNDYMSRQLGAAPTTSNEYKINNANPLQAGLMGGIQGYGFGNTPFGQTLRQDMFGRTA